MTHRYNTDTKTANKKSELALKMRHAQDTAQRAYYKIQPDTNLNNKDDNEIIKNQQATINALTIQVNELKSKLEQYQPTEGDKLFNKRRGDIVARLNKGLNVKPETLQKYNININKDTLKAT